ncbi:GrdX family protein [Clostridium sp.]|uniref:GrdX family protein n=1 Tax=Clostridium sp. TaxID=1506 RepID=UPI003EEC95C1
MIEPLIIVTNNPMSKEQFESKYTVVFIKRSMMDILKKVRNNIHDGHKLLTHPLMSSVKPNETPYRTICISKEKLREVDLQSLSIIEESIMSTEKFLNDFKTPQWNEKILLDFQLIDYDIIHHALN